MNPALLLIPLGALFLLSPRKKPPPPPEPVPGGGLEAVSRTALAAARAAAPRITSAAEAAAAATRAAVEQQRHAQHGLEAPKRRARQPGDHARRRAARHRRRAERLRRRAAELRAQGVFVDEVIGYELTTAGEAGQVLEVGELGRWMDREARSAGALLRQAARCSSPRQATFRAHGWRVSYAAPPFHTWSVIATWEMGDEPTPADREYVARIARSAGAQGRVLERPGMLVWRWKGRV